MGAYMKDYEYTEDEIEEYMDDIRRNLEWEYWEKTRNERGEEEQ